jgi:hypothetical protein
VGLAEIGLDEDELPWFVNELIEALAPVNFITPAVGRGAGLALRAAAQQPGRNAVARTGLNLGASLIEPSGPTFASRAANEISGDLIAQRAYGLSEGSPEWLRTLIAGAAGAGSSSLARDGGIDDWVASDALRRGEFGKIPDIALRDPGPRVSFPKGAMDILYDLVVVPGARAQAERLLDELLRFAEIDDRPE